MRNIPNGMPIVARIGGIEVRCVVERDTGEGYVVHLPFLYHQPQYNHRLISYVDVVELEG